MRQRLLALSACVSFLSCNCPGRQLFVSQGDGQKRQSCLFFLCKCQFYVVAEGWRWITWNLLVCFFSPAEDISIHLFLHISAGREEFWHWPINVLSVYFSFSTYRQRRPSVHCGCRISHMVSAILWINREDRSHTETSAVTSQASFHLAHVSWLRLLAVLVLPVSSLPTTVSSHQQSLAYAFIPAHYSVFTPHVRVHTNVYSNMTHSCGVNLLK